MQANVNEEEAEVKNETMKVKQHFQVTMNLNVQRK